jgi:DNA-binding transcriptional regulator YdaS (Cro superfamily)
MTPTEAMEEAARIVGGKAVLANLLEISAPTVSQWCSGSRPVPAERALQIEIVTTGQVRREALCPSFPWKEAAAPLNAGAPWRPGSCVPFTDRRMPRTSLDKPRAGKRGTDMAAENAAALERAEHLADHLKHLAPGKAVG